MAEEAPSNVDRLPLCSRLLDGVAEGREERVVHQHVKIRTDWWNKTIVEFELPGGPIEAASLDRADIWALAAAAGTRPESSFRLLWHALAWGSGNKLRLNRKRLKNIAADTDAVGGALLAAARLASKDAEAAYESLRPANRNLVGFLGPAFLTKYLYFAGGGNPHHPSLILDSRVATTLKRQCGWTSLSSAGGWPTTTYGRYCQLLQRWAEEASDELGRQVAADEIERWLFSPGAQ